MTSESLFFVKLSLIKGEDWKKSDTTGLLPLFCTDHNVYGFVFFTETYSWRCVMWNVIYISQLLIVAWRNNVWTWCWRLYACVTLLLLLSVHVISIPVCVQQTAGLWGLLEVVQQHCQPTASNPHKPLLAIPGHFIFVDQSSVLPHCLGLLLAPVLISVYIYTVWIPLWG